MTAYTSQRASAFIAKATRSTRFIARVLGTCRITAAHCNGSGHVPGCNKGEASDKQLSSQKPDTRRPDTPEETEKLRKYKYERMRQAQAEAKAVVPQDVHTPIDGIPDAKIHGSDIEEMLNVKAVRASIRNGVSPDVHEEAVLRTAEILPRGHVTGTIPGGKKTKSVINARGEEVERLDPIENKYQVETVFKAKDGKPYSAVYTIHQYRQKGMKPKVYFMFCKK